MTTGCPLPSFLPSERAEQLRHPDIGRSARLDMRKALELAVESLSALE